MPLLAATPNQPRRSAFGSSLDVGVERYLVLPGSCHVLALRPGDLFEMTPLLGAVSPRLMVFRSDGSGGLEVWGLESGADTKELEELLSYPGEDSQRVLAGLAVRGLDPGSCAAASLVFEESGDRFAEVAPEPLTLVVWLPKARMLPWDQDPPAPLLLHLRRSSPGGKPEARLPEPLADMRLDLTVSVASAIVYEVCAGEFIQIIDVSGRQCSDFLAFRRAALDCGMMRGMDSTTTRTLNGTSYPMPGLAPRYFDADRTPMVEVVKDMVGRHDTFNLACTSRYYEDQGYFGHANCTDNFNRSLSPFGISEYRGWPAINFFYNTRIDANHHIWLDDPWSRPGDFVMLRAATDLLCASSSCPSDIDPANGWELSEIQVRVYSPRALFKRSIGYRMTADTPLLTTEETGFHPRTSQLTRRFTAYRGHWLPSGFADGGAISEYLACREAAAVMDLSALRKLEILGPDAELFLQGIFPRDIRKLDILQVLYSPICYEHGGMIDDGTLFRLGRDNFRWIGGDDAGILWIKEKAEVSGLRVHVRESTRQLHNLAVQGPNSREILRTLVWTAPGQPTCEELKPFRFTIGRIGGYEGLPIVLSRTGYTGELGYEVFCHPSDAPSVWDAVLGAGEGHGLRPLGLEALDLLRIEAGLIASGNEFDSTTDPFEAGIGFAVAKNKTDDYIGKDALLRRSAHPQRKLCGLVIDSQESAGHGDPVFMGLAQVGVVTSACRSPILGLHIALARLDVHAAESGTSVEIGRLDGVRKRLTASVTTIPFYDPSKSRLRS